PIPNFDRRFHLRLQFTGRRHERNFKFERRTGEEADEAAIPVDHHFAEGRVVSTEQNRRAANFNRNLVLLIQPFTCSPFSGGTAVALLSYQAATRRPRPRMPAALPALKGSNGKATRQ